MAASPVQYSPSRNDSSFFNNVNGSHQSRHHNGGVPSPKQLQNNNSSPNQLQKLSGDDQQQQQYKEEWFSLEGCLFMKCQSGALNFLQSRKRLYFGLEECDNKLIYYRDKVEFNRKRECIGTIPLHNAVCSLIEGNLCAFVLHTAGKKYVMEADNARCANCWLNALQQRRDLSDALSAAELPTLITAALRRRRSRSRSRSTACSSPSPIRRPATAAVDGIVTPFPRDESHQSMVDSMSSGHLLLAQKSPYRQRVGRCETIDVEDDSPPAPSPVRKSSARSVGLGDAPAAWLTGWICGWLGDQQQHQQQNPQPNGQHNGHQIEQENDRNVSKQKQNHKQLNGPKTNNVAPEDDHLSYLDSNLESATQLSFTYVDPAAEGAAAMARRRAPRLMLRRISVQELAHNLLMPGTLTGRKPTKSTSALHDSPSPQYSCPSSPGRTATSPSTDGGVSPNPAHFFDELSMLRIVDNRQKERIHELNAECTALARQLEQLHAQQLQQQQRQQPSGTVGVSDSAASLAIATQNRFLNAELLRVNNRYIESEKKVQQCNARIEALESEIEEFKRQYVFLLQSCIRVPLHEHSSCDVVQVKLFGGDIHKYRVCMLLDKAREVDPTLPTFESLTTSGSYHIDDYGFRHTFEDVSLALHYISTQLHEHYEFLSDDYVALKCKWKEILDASSNFIKRTRENRHLCRLGIPRVWRSRVWRLLIHQQVASLKEQYGEYYYRNLCSSQGTPAEKHYCSTHQKQINLDLLRTMPGNIHFMSASCKGVTHLQAVLRAFCLHNPTTGYCQGMNFLAATALLFVSPEDAFWFLVAVSERYFHPSYFDQSLSGAQADQEVLKEIVEQKFPRLANHLEECDIDLTTITLNWFLALFFDAVPFQTMLRVWDCFLFEGPKVLFRFTIALLGLYQDEILDHTDTISVMKVLKAAVRLTYDVDGLIKYSFEELNPFPSKAFLRQRHAQYLDVLQEKLHKRLQLRKLFNVVSNPSPSDKICDLPIEVIVFSDFVTGHGYVCAGNEKRGKLSLISFHDEAANLNTLDIEFDCRPVSMVIFHEEMAFVSLLSGYIVAVQLHDDHQAEILWELKLNDVALKLLRCDNRLYSSLANGTLTILENAFEKMPSTLDLYHIPVSAAPITDALFDDENLYLAVACKIVILNRHTLHTIASVYVASSATGSQVPMFEKIRALSNSEHGIWLITAHSSLLQLWHSNECQMLFDITYDHSHRRPSLDDDEQLEQVEIYSIMYHQNEVWIGTVDGYLMLYRVLEQSATISPSVTRRRAVSASAASLTTSSNTGTTTTVAALAAAAAARVCATNARRCESDDSLVQTSSDSQSRYPPGKRLSPIQNLTKEIPRHRQQMYYIPTDAETRVEESASVNEYPESERQTRKISVIIDQSSRQYSVNVKPLTRQLNEDACVVRAVSLSLPPMTEQHSNFKSRTSEPSKLSSIDCTALQTVADIASFNRDNGNSNECDNTVIIQYSLDGSETRLTRSSIPPRLNRPGSAPLPDIVSKLSAASSDAGFSSGANSPPLSASVFSAKSSSEAESTPPSTPQHHHRSSRRFVPQSYSSTEIGSAGAAEFGSDESANSYGCAGRSPLHMVSMSSSGTFCLPSFPSTIAEEEPTDVTASATSERNNSPTRLQTVGKNEKENLSLSTTAARMIVGSALDDVNVDQLEQDADDAHEHHSSEPSEPAGDAMAAEDAEVYYSSFKLRRKDLDFDANLLAAVNQTEEGTSLSTTPVNESSSIVREEPKIKSSMEMSLQMKLKISDKPVKCISLTRFNGEDVVVTGAGNYGDEEAILRWRREKNSGLWINDPLVDMCIRGRKRTLISEGGGGGNDNATISKRT